MCLVLALKLQISKEYINGILTLHGQLLLMRRNTLQKRKMFYQLITFIFDKVQLGI